jgi:hypothetical protein
MLIFAFDASGDETTPYMTVAGFASSANDWDEFSATWKNRLDQDGIAFFRAVDFASFRGPFQHWHDRPDRDQLRRLLSSDLMEILQAHVYHKFGCTVVNKDFANASDAVRKEFALRAYSLAGRTCEKYARKWAIEDWRLTREMKLALIFEAGDRGHGALQGRLTRDGGHIPANFKPKRDTARDDGTIERGFVPLQAADWLAWEVNRATRDFYEGKVKSESELRWAMRRFLKAPVGFMGIYTLENFHEIEGRLQLQNEMVNWQIATGLSEKMI